MGKSAARPKLAKRKVSRKTAVIKPISKRKPDEELAERCASLQLQVMRAGRSLHDQAGPLLSAAGIHLQLLKLDLPEAAPRIQEVTSILEQALGNVREVSQTLASSPVFRGGLQRALDRLVEEVSEAAPVDIVLDCDAGASLARESAVAAFEAISAALKAAVLLGGATEVEIIVRQKGTILAKISDNGRPAGRTQALTMPRLLASQSGLKLDMTTGKSTIVSIRAYALRRAAG